MLLPLWVCSQTHINLVPVPGSVYSPVAMTHAGDGSGRIYICEQHGVIRVGKPDGLYQQPFLDIRHKMLKQLNMYSERGLLGLAFHPDYRHNRKFYVYYSAKSNEPGSNHKSVIAEYQTSVSNPLTGNPSSERILLEIEEPESNHNGGPLVFGPDGFLYIGVGDGGGANDQHGATGNGQRTDNLLGKILRIDVNTPNGYRIPPDNPFVGKSGRDEIWAYGLRNPWKLSFDSRGRLFCADVGQDEFEEVNIIEKGKNYGWRIMEGNHCFNPPMDCRTAGLEKPIYDYHHGLGSCVIGGYVYRGSKQAWSGQYIFADWVGKVFILKEVRGQWEFRQAELHMAPKGGFSINSLGEDEKGDLYLLGQQSIGPSKNAFLFKLDLKD